MKFNLTHILRSITLTLLLTIFSATTAQALIFTDVGNNHPYLPAIRYLKQHGVVQGYPDGSFKPNQEVNRAEALKIITLSKTILGEGAASEDAERIFNEQATANMAATADVDFDLHDVPHQAWFHKYVLEAYKNEIINGYSDRTFRPSKTVNLAEALKILLETNEVTLPTDDSIAKDPYKDAYMNEWYAPYFQFAKDTYVLIADLKLKVYPDQPITRQELANLIFRFYSLDEAKTFGRASYYADFFDGRTTASGEIFRQDEFTAAHLTLPFGTLIKVVNLENEKSVVVRVTDRGPYDQRFVVDLSKTAFETISPLSRGVIQVYYEVIHTP